MSEPTYPDHLHYHEAHDWAQADGEDATFGITWYAQDALGDVVFFNPPEVGSKIVAGGSYGELESVKAVSDLIAPLDGEVVAVNDAVVESPELVNEDPYGAWLIKVRLSSTDQISGLMGADAYRDFVGA